MSAEGKGQRVKDRGIIQQSDHDIKEGKSIISSWSKELLLSRLKYLRKREVKASSPETQTFILFHTDWLTDCLANLLARVTNG